MKAITMNFTERSILNIVPVEKTTVYKDDKTDYLFLYVTKHINKKTSKEETSKIFYYIRKVKGRVRFIKIDSLDNISLQAAKDKVTEYNSAFLAGRDPGEEKKLISKEITLTELFQEYKKAKEGQKRTLKEDERKLKVYLAPIANKKLTAITFKKVSEVHKELSNKGKYQANRCLALISGLFTFAKKYLRLAVENPVYGIEKNIEYARRRILTKSELKKFLDTLNKWQQYPNRILFADIFKIMLLSGQRKGNVLSMKWKDIDFEAKKWHISHIETKNQRDQSVSLQPGLIEILQRRYQELKGKSQFVFPSPKIKYTDVPIIEIKCQWNNLLKDAGLIYEDKEKSLRIHDIRRTLGSTLLMAGIDMKTVSEILGHRDAATTDKHYSKILEDHKAKAANKAEDVFSGIMKSEG